MSDRRSWYEIKNAAKGQADIYLYDEIGFFGVPASAFVDALRNVTAPTINLYVNSPGGDVADGTAIHSAIARHPATVNAIVDGIAASAASFIVQAGNHRVMSRGSTMMIHEPHGMAMGDAATMTKMAEELDVVGENIAQIYADRAGGTVDDWRAAMREETWYKAKDAVDAGLADEMAGATKATNAIPGRIFNLSKFKNVPDWAQNSPIAGENRPDQAEIGVLRAPDGTVIHYAMSGVPTTVWEPVSPVDSWPLIDHHDEHGAVSPERLAVASARAKNTLIPVPDRVMALRHLEKHLAESRTAA